MRRLLVAMLFVVAPAFAEPAYRLILGDRMPDLELTRLDGRRVQTSAYRGGAIALTFFSPYCEPCKVEVPVLARVVERVSQGASEPVKMVVVAIDGTPDAVTVAKAPEADWLLDPTDRARYAFDPRTLPCTFLIDDAGTVRHINRGFGKGYEARVERWLRSMRAGDAGTK